MSVRKLPDGAYAALEGLQGQAKAAMAMLPGQDKAEAKEALRAAQAKMAANEEWTRKIVKALMSGDGTTTTETADAAWLERTFAETF
ncbi:hypothetical protein ACGTN6_20940 [Halomonas sp. THAF12]|uniref:hypothetical protein n=1 Tax=Halomonas sp. B23F22_10 TaxID=3459515 RepID=UPI00373E5998